MAKNQDSVVPLPHQKNVAKANAIIGIAIIITHLAIIILKLTGVL